MGEIWVYNKGSRNKKKGGMQVKVIIKVGGRWKGDREVETLFALYAERIMKTMRRQAEDMRFRLPGKISLRPFYFKGEISNIYGRARYEPYSGFSILISVPDCINLPDKGLWVVDHECAHIASAIKHKDWSHGEKFHEIYASCRKEETEKASTASYPSRSSDEKASADG